MLYAWELETFLEVADAGSFAKGAEKKLCNQHIKILFSFKNSKS